MSLIWWKINLEAGMCFFISFKILRICGRGNGFLVGFILGSAGFLGFVEGGRLVLLEV